MNHIPPALRPDRTVDLILNPGAIRRAAVLAIPDDCIILSNQRRTLGTLNVSSPAILTYLSEKMPFKRYGFDITITSIPDGYVLADRTIPAVAAVQVSPARKMDLRAFPRIQAEGLCLFLGEEELDIMDISAGGAHLIRKNKGHINAKVGDLLPLRLERRHDIIMREAKILRLWSSRGIHGCDHLAVKFVRPVDF
jgi:hypothetical protein